MDQNKFSYNRIMLSDKKGIKAPNNMDMPPKSMLTERSHTLYMFISIKS